MDEQLSEFLGWRLSDSRYDRELWEFEYDNYRYLRNLSDEALDQRYEQLCRNLAFLICDLRDEPPLRAHFLSSWWWLRKYAHMIYEYRQRARTSPAAPLAVEAAGAPASPIRTPSHPNACDFVVRYSEERWLREFIDRGVVRIAPASSYLGEHLDEARQDDELNRHRYERGDLVRVTTQDGQQIPIIGDLQRTTSFSVNYYVICCSNEHDTRLFSAFPNSSGEPAESCVIIWDIEEFARRLELASSHVLQNWYFHYNPVAYFDPYEVRPREHIDPGMSKDFRYAYQREYRFLWLPISGGTANEPIFLTLGPLTDIASLYSNGGAFLGGRPSP